MALKKIVYITLFTIFGITLQFLAHALVEIVYIKLLLTQYDIFGLDLPFSTWFTIHTVFTVIFFIVGVVAGFSQGKYWWKRLYEEGGMKKV